MSARYLTDRFFIKESSMCLPYGKYTELSLFFAFFAVFNVSSVPAVIIYVKDFIFRFLGYMGGQAFFFAKIYIGDNYVIYFD